MLNQFCGIFHNPTPILNLMGQKQKATFGYRPAGQFLDSLFVLLLAQVMTTAISGIPDKFSPLLRSSHSA